MFLLFTDKAGLIYTIYKEMGNLLDSSNPDHQQSDSNIVSVTTMSLSNSKSLSPPSVHVSLRHTSKYSGKRQCAKWIYTDA